MKAALIIIISFLSIVDVFAQSDVQWLDTLFHDLLDQVNPFFYGFPNKG